MKIAIYNHDMTSVADILRQKGKFTVSSVLVEAIVECSDISIRQAYRRINGAEKNKEIRRVLLPDRKVLYGLPSWPIEIHRGTYQLQDVPRVDFEITQRQAGNPLAKRKFPSVGFNLISKSRFPVRMRIEALPLLGDRKLDLIQDKKKYYCGETVVGPYDYNEGFVNGNFTAPPICVNSSKELTIVVRVTLIDPFQKEHTKIKGWTYIRKKNDWFYEPKDFSEMFT